MPQGVVDSESARLRGSPTSLDRPVIVLGGWRAPGFSTARMIRLLRSMTTGSKDDFLSISYPHLGTIPDAVEFARKKITAANLKRAPDGAIHIDIVAISMGGLVARSLAAANVPGLRITRIFTLATPHRGAKLALHFAPDPASYDMRPNSRFLAWLDGALPLATYDLICYTLLRDWWVGAKRTAPPGQAPIWIDASNVFENAFSHFMIAGSRRIAIDIARRLRGEQPVARVGLPPPID